ncbi:hypothetical protein C8Q77DRAFT_1064917 [Trametes polyzona]|nr:hypothetical protein C8Q77DRAFT_1064917 [Trametes polyzona]
MTHTSESRAPNPRYHGAYPERYATDSRGPKLPPDRDLKEGLVEEPLLTLPKPPVDGGDESPPPLRPENLKYLGSYNWVEDATPTIIVPGSPPVWRERTVPYDVPYDTGERMIDQNGYRMQGASALLPLFRAVDTIAEENADASLDWSAVDFVTDRNGLRKLLRWLRHADTGQEAPLKAFRIDLQLGGAKTVLMHRWEKRMRQIARPPKTGCGLNFEHESTTPAPGCGRSTGHHRIIQYDLDGLKMIVRFEVDACLPHSALSMVSTVATSSGSNGAAPGDVGSLTNAFANLGVSSPVPDTSPPTNLSRSSDIAVILAGSQVPQGAIVELATRSKKISLDWNEQYPQLLLSYTPNFFLGVHDRGTFKRVRKLVLGSEELGTVERNVHIQRTLRRLVAVLRTIQDLVKEHGRAGKLSLVCQGRSLKVFERTSDAGCLSEDELERFDV